jgi:two-component system chemotaxis response regulator CheB
MMARSLIRVLVIDDSAFSRQAITRMLDASPLVEVVGVARDGEEALRKTFELQPDLITVDLEMPRMDGFTFLRVVMSKRPTPVIVVSGRTGEEDVFRALELGAVDFVGKPSPRATPELNNIEHELVRKVHAIRDLRIEKVQTRIGKVPVVTQGESTPLSSAPLVVAIGS